METTREAPIWNQHFDPVGTRVEKPLFRTPKLRFQPTISLIPRFSSSSVSLDYVNRWRGQHTKSAYHGDRKSCSTRLEISTPGRTYGCTNIADIVTPYGLFPPLQRKDWAKLSARASEPLISTSLDYVNHWWGQHTESAYHGDRKSCSTRLEISTLGRRYGCTNIADIVTPSGLFPPL
ncbi:hypothetical protein Taro_024733 [Colocasia esculenta]|uniref:Uncharacterized protein n=1 Tax=Colocasia esculenta TaxID=4460 RepID=A0A843V8A1_COLES|nr:hypothetical protein [Colocasia esculenta]